MAQQTVNIFLDKFAMKNIITIKIKDTIAFIT